MKRKLIILVMLIILGTVTGIILSGCGSDNSKKSEQSGKTQLWTCGMHPEVILEEPGQCPKCGMNLVPVKTGMEENHEHEGHDHSEHADTQLYTCPMHPEVLTEEPGSCPKCGMDLVPVKKTGESKKTTGKKGKILYWRAPMDPTEIYDHPGKSRMGMDLIPVYEGEAELGQGGTISIDPRTVQNMGVRFSIVEKGTFSRTIRSVGYVEYDETKLYTVNTKISGWIEKLYVDYTGKPVYKNQPLLEIYSPELVTTQEEYLLALNNFQSLKNSPFKTITESAEQLLASSKQRLQYWDIPEKEIKTLEQTGKIKKTMTLYAPFKGVVVHKNAIEGTHVKEGQDLYKIADLSNVWILASIYDNELPWIYENQEATITLSYYPGEQFTGKITYIYPYLDKKARDVKVRMEFPNPENKLKPGMYANIYIKGKPMEDVLLIPEEAVLRSGKRNIVFVSRGEGKFEPREIKVGAEGDHGKLMVISGLLEGEKIVTSSQFMLDSESKLQEAIQKMLKEKMKN
ncbi:MAG: hypothetical protein Kow00108_06700 [Calditrichia bacterium]